MVDAIEAVDLPDFFTDAPDFKSNLYHNIGFASLHQKIFELVRVSEERIERRAIIDVGSGGTKYAIADYHCDTGELHVILEGKISVAYQRALENSPEREFDRAIRTEGLAAFREIKEVCETYQVDKIHAVATEAFRQAGESGRAFTEEVLGATGISVNIIDQTVEGCIAYYNALQNTSLEEKELVVWEIGTGSFQIVAKGAEDYHFHMGAMGSVPFYTEILKEVEGDILSIDETGLQKADRLARAIARKGEKMLKERIREEADRHVVGIGNFFVRSLGQYAQDPTHITRSDLRHFIRETLENDTTSEDPFLRMDLSNAILALGFMKALQIHEIHTLDVSNTEAMLTYSPFWKA